jgi:hypothetical protein
MERDDDFNKVITRWCCDWSRPMAAPSAGAAMVSL